MCILVVDDEPLVLMLLAEVLKDAGHDVLTTDDGIAALRVVKEVTAPLSCLVTDFQMPGLDGAELIDRTRKFHPTLPIVLSTARGTATTPLWRTKNRVELLLKPYSPKQLLDMIDRLIVPGGGGGGGGEAIAAA